MTPDLPALDILAHEGQLEIDAELTEDEAMRQADLDAQERWMMENRT